MAKVKPSLLSDEIDTAVFLGMRRRFVRRQVGFRCIMWCNLKKESFKVSFIDVSVFCACIG